MFLTRAVIFFFQVMPFHPFSPTITQSANQLWEVMCIADVKIQICMASTYLEIQWPRKSFNCHLRRPNNAPCAMRPDFFQLGACKDGAVMRAFPSHTNVAWVGILGFVNLLFFFFLFGSFFYPFKKNEHSRFQLIWKQWTRDSLLDVPLPFISINFVENQQAKCKLSVADAERNARTNAKWSGNVLRLISLIFLDYIFFHSRMFTLTENKTTGVWEDKEICFGDGKYCTNKLSGNFEPYILSFGEDEGGIIVNYSRVSISRIFKGNEKLIWKSDSWRNRG